MGPREGVLWISSDRVDRIGGKSKPKKMPGPKFNPPKIPWRISEPLKFIIGTTWPGYVGVIMNLQIVLNTPKNPFLNQATRKKKNLPKFSTPQTSEIENFTPQKILWSFLSLEICSTPPGDGAAVWNLELFSLFYSLNAAKSIELACKRLFMVSWYWMIDVIHPIKNFFSVIGQC